MKAFTSEDPALPTDYPGFIFRMMRKEGHQAAALLAGTGLTEARLGDPNFRFAFWSLRRLVLNLLAESGDPHLGIRLAQQFEAAYMGLPAYAAMNAASLRDALGVLGRFIFLAFPTIGFELAESGDTLGAGEAAVRLRPRSAARLVGWTSRASRYISPASRSRPSRFSKKSPARVSKVVRF